MCVRGPGSHPVLHSHFLPHPHPHISHPGHRALVYPLNTSAFSCLHLGVHAPRLAFLGPQDASKHPLPRKLTSTLQGTVTLCPVPFPGCACPLADFNTPTHTRLAAPGGQGLGLTHISVPVKAQQKGCAWEKPAEGVDGLVNGAKRTRTEVRGREGVRKAQEGTEKRGHRKETETEGRQ